MLRPRVLIGLLAVAFLAGGFLSGDEPKKDSPTKVRGALPANWGKLGLSDEQKQKIYKVSDEYRAKIAPLEAQIKDLRKQQRADMEKVLTSAQKARLREILTDKAPGDDKKLDKPDPDKKP